MPSDVNIRTDGHTTLICWIGIDSPRGGPLISFQECAPTENDGCCPIVLRGHGEDCDACRSGVDPDTIWNIGYWVFNHVLVIENFRLKFRLDEKVARGEEPGEWE